MRHEEGKSLNIYASSLLLTAFSTGGVRIAVTWIALHEIGASAVSIVVATMAAAQFLGTLSAGSMTDRLNKLALSILTNTISCVGVLFLYVLSSSGSYSLFPLVIATAAIFYSMSIHDNAMRTVIPDLAADKETIAIYNGYFVSLTQTGMFVSPIFVGLIIDNHSESIAFLLLNISYLFAAALLFLLSRNSKALEPKSFRVASIYKRRRKYICNRLFSGWARFGVIASLAANILILPISTVLMPIYIVDIGYTATELGYFYASLSAGFVLGGFVASHKKNIEPVALKNVLVGAAMFYLLISQTKNIPLIVLLGVAAGGMLSIFEVKWNETLQNNSPSAILGRMYGTIGWMSFAARTFGVAVCGYVLLALPAAHLITLFSGLFILLLLFVDNSCVFQRE